jgi:H+ antiporter protein
MLSPLRNRTYRHLFAAQVIALLGTGLATVALGLLAYQLAGEDAGIVLGTALAIKMIAYVGVSPIANVFVDIIPRRRLLIGLDVVRATIALMLPFVDQIWQVYVLIFILQSSSAAFTPTFQATIPDILPDEKEYTKALSLSRLAYDLESLISPALAAALLTVISFHWLFAGTALGFVASALLVLSVRLPIVPHAGADIARHGIYERTTKGIRYYLATPRLRGLLSLNLAAAAAGAMVIVNTVVYVRAGFGGDQSDVAVALAFFGAGSMAAALILPKLLETRPDRPVMISAAVGLVTGLLVMGIASLGGTSTWSFFLGAWLFLGFCYSGVLTPAGRLLRRSAHAEDRPAVFAAQFALSHACWLVTYPLAGWVGAAFGLSSAFLLLAGLAAAGVAAALVFWPTSDPEVLSHVHNELPLGHPHLRDAKATPEGPRHAHAFVIDEHHRRWPSVD